jgi:hypothetical protein
VSDTKTQSSSVVLDRREWDSLVEDVRRLAQTYERLLSRIDVRMTSPQGTREARPPGQEKGLSGSGAFGFTGVGQEPVISPATFPRMSSRVCVYCGAGLDSADRFCRICGGRQMTTT